jgi:hypothetical protein
MFVAIHAPKVINWCARLVPGDSARERINRGQEPAQGILRIAAHEQRGSLLRGSISEDGLRNAVDTAKLGPLDPFDGWTVGGRARIFCTGEGCYGLSLYGFAPGLKVAWVAASLST